MNLCVCVHSDPIACLMKRYSASSAFSVCMGGCSCQCHYRRDGVLVASGDWLNNRYAVARQPVKRHTDPRIEAVMPKEVSER